MYLKPMSQIRITKTAELESILKFLKNKWPLMNEVEIVKMAISNFFNQEKDDFSNLPVEYLNMEDSLSLEESRKDMREGNYTAYTNTKDMLNDILSDKV